MIIKFGEDADNITMGAILEGLTGWTLKVEWTQPNMENFPELCSIDRVNRDDLVMCDVDEIGRPLVDSLYYVDYDRIVSITVI